MKNDTLTINLKRVRRSVRTDVNTGISIAQALTVKNCQKGPKVIDTPVLNFE